MSRFSSYKVSDTLRTSLSLSFDFCAVKKYEDEYKTFYVGATACGQRKRIKSPLLIPSIQFVEHVQVLR